MKNNKLNDFLRELKSVNPSGKAGYAIAKNRKLIEEEIEALESTIKTKDNLNEYNKARIELLEKHAQKDEKGNSITEIKGNESHYILKDEKAFEKEFEKLKETHKQAIKDREKQIEDFNKLMQEKANITLFNITEDQIPETATANEVYVLLKLVK